ncbi:MAG: class I SAM-dependent methyltransferase [Gammaproteobacteria bacterium]|nr:class I SAM-dependent methyltransferase [Gammaproteobacteria bacterium]
MIEHTIAVSCQDTSRIDEAYAVATRLGLPFQQTAKVQLCLLPDKWALQQKGMLPVAVEFDTRCWRANGKIDRQEGLIRACQPEKGYSITDLTAGFARDAALLAFFGARLTLVERDPIMGVLLEDGIKRGLTQGLLQPGQVTLVLEDALSYLEGLDEALFPDVMYVDPMHPVRTKSANVKKALQCLQVWMMPDLQPEVLLEAARRHVKEKVVMKWPVHREACAQVNYSIPGKTIRFDVYLPYMTPGRMGGAATAP